MDFNEYLAERRAVLGDRLTTDYIDPRYIPYWEAGVRLMVRWPDGTTLIGKPTLWGGYKERFLLMVDGAVGSTHQLTPDTEVLAVERAATGEWEPLVEDMPDPASITSKYLGDEASPLSPRHPDV